MEILKRMWKHGEIELSLLTCVVLLVTGVSSSLEEEDLTLQVNTRKPVSVYGDKFLSVAIDPLAILTSEDVAKDYEKSVKLIGALRPAYLRLGGPRTNTYLLGDHNDTNYVFAEENWIRLHRWAARTGLDVIACISARFMENDNKVDLLSLTDRLGFNVSWQLGYECQTRCDLAGSDVGKYVRILRYRLDAIPRYSNSIITGPDVVAYGTKEQREYLENFFSEADEALTALTWHPDFAGVTRNDEGVFVHHDRLASEKADLYRAIGRDAAKKPLWIAESRAEASKNQFLGALVWTNRLGNAAKLGVQVLMREPSDLAKATPDYWVSLLHKRLVGREVFDAKIQTGNRSHVHFYVQCTKSSAVYERGALTIFGVNLTPTKIRANVKGLKLKTLHEYVLMPGFDAPNRMFAESVLLNGKPLNLINDTELPNMEALTLNDEKGLSIELPSGGIGFWVVPDLKIKSCMDHRDEKDDEEGVLDDRTSQKNSSKEENEREEDNEIRRGKRLIDHQKTIARQENRRRKSAEKREGDGSERKLRKIDAQKELEKLGKILKRRFARRESKKSTSNGSIESLDLFGFDPKKEASAASETIESTEKRSKRDVDGFLAESHRTDRKYKRKDDTRRNVQPWMLSGSKRSDSAENSFYGFFKQEPIANFPKGDVFLATGDSKEQEERDYDYVEDDDEIKRGEKEKMRKPQAMRIGTIDRAEPDDTWIDVGDYHRDYMPNGFFETSEMATYGNTLKHDRRSKRKVEDLNAIFEREMIDEDNGNSKDCRCRVIRESNGDSELSYSRRRRNANESEDRDMEGREENDEAEQPVETIEQNLDDEINETPTIVSETNESSEIHREENHRVEDELLANEEQFFRGEREQPEETTATIDLDEDHSRDTPWLSQDTKAAPEENNFTTISGVVVPEKRESTESSSRESSGTSSRDEEATTEDLKSVDENRTKIALKREISSGKVTKRAENERPSKSLGSPKETSKGSKKFLSKSASSSKTKIQSNPKASDAASASESRVTSRNEALSALKRGSISNEKHRDHRRERTEKLEMLRRRLVAKREEILRQYEEELLDAMRRSDIDEEREEEKRKRNKNRRNLKREIWERLTSTDEYRDMLDREKVAYVLTYGPINYDRLEKEKERPVKDERKYIPVAEITRPVYKVQEKLIDEPAKAHRYLQDPRVMLYAKSDGSNSRAIQSRFPYDIIGERERYGGDQVASGKRYYALVDSTEEDPWMFQYQRRSKERQRNVYESGGRREKQLDDSVRTYETPIGYVYEESDETIDSDESSNSRSTERKIYAIDPSTYKGGEPEVKIHEDFEESSENNNEDNDKLYRVILKSDQAQKNAPTLYILDEKRQNDRKKQSNLVTYILGRRHANDDVEKRSDVEDNPTISERDVTEAMEKLETKENITSEINNGTNSREKFESIEETSKMDSNEEKGSVASRRTRRDIGGANSGLLNKVPLLLMRKAPYDKNRKARSEPRDYLILNDDRSLDGSVRNSDRFSKLFERLDSFESVERDPIKNMILLPQSSKHDFYDDNNNNNKQYESSMNDRENDAASKIRSSFHNDLLQSKSKLSENPILTKHIYAYVKETGDKKWANRDDLNEEKTNELWEFKPLLIPEEENYVDIIKTNDRKDGPESNNKSSSFLQGALPKLQEVITDGFDKAQNLTESLEQFVESFDKNFNETQRMDDNKNGTLKRNANTATHDIFRTAIINVKKFFAFLGGMSRIFYA